MANNYPERIDWKDFPSTKSPINSVNLNKMDIGLYDVAAQTETNETNIGKVQEDVGKAQGDILKAKEDIAKALGSLTASGISYDSTASKLSAVTTQGAIDTLKTISDSQLTEITTLKKSVADGKSAVASAITAKGVNTASDAVFDTMATNIGTACTNNYNSGYNAGRAVPKSATCWLHKNADGSFTVGVDGSGSGYAISTGGLTERDITVEFNITLN